MKLKNIFLRELVKILRTGKRQSQINYKFSLCLGITYSRLIPKVYRVSIFLEIQTLNNIFLTKVSVQYNFDVVSVNFANVDN